MKAENFNTHPLGSLRKNAPYKRGKPSTKALNRPVDFRRLRVLALRDGGGDAMILTLALSASDAILAGIAVTDALTIASCGPGSVIGRPIIAQDGETALVVRVQAPPSGIEVGATVDISAVFRLDGLHDMPAVEAVVSTIRVRRRPAGLTKITLPAVGDRYTLTDADIGLPDDLVAQERAERFLRAAIGHRLHQDAKARETARKDAMTVNVELDDDALHLAHVTDRAIDRELRRIAARTDCSNKAARTVA